VYLRSSALFWLGIAVTVFGAAGAFLFANNVAADHRLNPTTSKLGASNLSAVTASDTAWMWGCIVIGALGLIVTVAMIVRSRRG
jgi:hypothetical protein